MTNFLKYIFGLYEPFTQTTEKEREAVAKYASGKRSAIEIGVFEGVNTVIVGQHIDPSAKVYGIDPFFKGRLGLCYHEYIARINIRRHKVGNKVILIAKLSADAVRDTPAEADFIFIDGDHSYNGIKNDWELYSKKIVPGGIIALHDTSVPDFDPGRRSLESIRFFEEVIKYDNDFERLETVDSLNVLRKKSTC